MHRVSPRVRRFSALCALIFTPPLFQHLAAATWQMTNLVRKYTAYGVVLTGIGVAVLVVFVAHLGVSRYWAALAIVPRSEEHTSELQSQSNLVCRLLLEKK